MKTLGSLLREQREKRGVSLEKLSKRTHIPVEILSALENETPSLLPADTLVQGYLQLCASELEMPAETLLALYRRDLQSRQTVAPVRRHTRWRGTTQLLQPKTLSLTLLALVVMAAGVFLARQWHFLGQPPTLEVLSPEHQSTTVSPVTVLGRTDPNATLTLNTELVALDPEGNFQSTLVLPEGERTLVFEARDNQGRKTRRLVFITVVSDQP